MRMYRVGIMSFLTVLLVAFIAGCGQETVTVPAVVSAVPAQGATGVVINTTISATFSMAMNPTTLDASTFTVTGPGGTAVAGTVAYSGTTATFTPSAVLAYSSLYTATITTGAKNLGGVPLVGNYVWSFTTITPPPTVIATIPANGATNVPIGQVLSATFSEAMTPASISAATFTVTGPGGTAVAGAVAYSGTTATFTPAANLANSTLYTATITIGAASLAGTPLAAAYQWTFTTITPPPVVTSTVPVNTATGVPLNQVLSATFNEAVACAALASPATAFTVAGPGSTPVAGTVSCSGSVATFTPGAALAVNTLYTATISTSATSVAGTPLSGNYVWTFRTVPAPTAPTVISTVPADGAAGVPINQVLTATFSEAMNSATISSTTFTLSAPGGVAVTGKVTYVAAGSVATFAPAANLASSTVYTATITTGAMDLEGNALASNYVWTFTTGTTLDTTAPELVSTVPANAAKNVPLNQAVSATFTEAMNPLSLTTATFTLTGPGGKTVDGTVSYDAIDFIATFTPTAPLTASSSYIATVTTGATDQVGNPLGTTGAPNPWNFTTGAAVVPPPIVLGPTIMPFGGLGGGAGMTNQGIHTVVNGSIATTGVSTKITGFHDDTVMVAGIPQCVYTETTSDVGLVTGAIDTAPPPPTVGCPNEGTAETMAIATQAALEARTAYTTLSTLPPGITLPSNELGNLTLPPGTYTSSSFYDITAGPLTLDAQGDPNAVWIFQIGSYLQVGTPTSSESVVLIRGAQAKNVYWAVGGLPGAVINYGGGGTMVGTIISQPGITVSSPGVAAVTTINGRVLALDASVTMVNTVINVPQ